MKKKVLFLCLFFILNLKNGNCDAFFEPDSLFGRQAAVLSTGVSNGFVGNNATSTTNQANYASYRGYFTAEGEECTASGIVNYLHCKFLSSWTGTARMGIYSSDGLTKLAETESFTVTDAAINHVALLSPLNITAGTKYRLVSETADTFGNYGCTTDGLSFDEDSSFAANTTDPLPATCTSTGVRAANRRMCIWASNFATF